MNDKAYSWFDVATKFVDVCYSCSSQNIKTIIEDTEFGKDEETLYCPDCDSRDIGAVPLDEVL